MVYSAGMDAPPKQGARKGGPQSAERAERLAAALRENLKRRKAQSRSQVKTRGDAGKSDDSGKAGG